MTTARQCLFNVASAMDISALTASTQDTAIGVEPLRHGQSLTQLMETNLMSRQTGLKETLTR